MFKFILVLFCTLSLLGSGYAIYEVEQMPKSQAFTAENVERVRANIPKEVPYSSEVKELYMDSVYEEIDCLQLNIFWEARNQDEQARVAVGWVTLNRVMGKRYPNSICEVVWDRKQFSWTHDGKSDKPNLKNKLEQKAWEESGEIAEHLVKHCLMQPDASCPDDPTNGAEYYFNPQLADPSWKVTKVKTATIDDHEFYSSPLASAH